MTASTGITQSRNLSTPDLLLFSTSIETHIYHTDDSVYWYLMMQDPIYSRRNIALSLDAKPFIPVTLMTVFNGIF